LKKNKTYYKDFCENNQLPIFFQPWWLNSLAGKDNWDVAIYRKSNEIFGVLPYYHKKKLGFKFLGLPILSQHLLFVELEAGDVIVEFIESEILKE
jgi:hypothetical protein